MDPTDIIKQKNKQKYIDYMNDEYNRHCQKKFNKKLHAKAKKIELENLLKDIANFNIKSLKKHEISKQLEKDIDKLDSTLKELNLDSGFLKFCSDF